MILWGPSVMEKSTAAAGLEGLMWKSREKLRWNGLGTWARAGWPDAAADVKTKAVSPRGP